MQINGSEGLSIIAITLSSLALGSVYEMIKINRELKNKHKVADYGSYSQPIPKQDKDIAKPGKQLTKTEIREKMKQLNDIIVDQNACLFNNERPSRNALDSKYQNSMLGRIKELEDMKIKIMKDMVDAGINPGMPIIGDDNIKRIVTFKDYLTDNMSGMKQDAPTRPSKPTFTLIQGEKK